MVVGLMVLLEKPVVGAFAAAVHVNRVPVTFDVNVIFVYH